MKSIGFMGASFETNNMGVAALSSGTVSAIHSHDPSAEVYLLDYAREPATYTVLAGDERKTVRLVNIRFSKKIFLENNIAYLIFLACLRRLIPIKGIRDGIVDRNPVLKTIMGSEFLCAISGGDSFSDIYGLQRLLYVSLPQLLVLILGKPLVLLPQTIGPFSGYAAKRIAKYILSRARIVYSRDLTGPEAVQAIFPGIGARFSYDMGFLLEPAVQTPKISEKYEHLRATTTGVKTVGINVSGLLMMGGYSRKNMFGLKTDYPAMIREIVLELLKFPEVVVVLVPHVFGDKPNTETDILACRELYDVLDEESRKRTCLLESRYDHHEIKKIIGSFDFFMGSRMHACIAGLSQCIPSVGLAYSDKFVGVYDSIGIPELVIDLRMKTCPEIIEELKALYRDRSASRGKLSSKIPEVKNAIRGMFSRVGIRPDETFPAGT